MAERISATVQALREAVIAYYDGSPNPLRVSGCSGSRRGEDPAGDGPVAWGQRKTSVADTPVFAKVKSWFERNEQTEPTA
jgi:hypothetical protein